MKNEIIRKPMVKERVEVNLLKLHITTRSRICRKCLTYLINSREASEKACEICLKLKLHKDIAAFQTLQTWIAHVAMFEKLTYPSVNAISVVLNVLPHITKLYKHGYALMYHVTITWIRYRTRYTCVTICFLWYFSGFGLFVTRYHHFF